MSFDFEHMLRINTKIKAGLLIEWVLSSFLLQTERQEEKAFTLAAKILNRDAGYYSMRLNEEESVNSASKHRGLHK